MWKIVFIMILYTGLFFILSQWYSEKRSAFIKMNILISIIYLLLLLFQQYIYQFPYIILFIIISFLFIILGFSFHFSKEEIIVPLLILLSSQTLLFPMHKLSIMYDVSWQYGSFVLVWFLSLLYVLLESKYFKIEKEWIRQLSLYNMNYQMKLIFIVLCYVLILYLAVFILFYESLSHCILMCFLICLSLIGIIKVLQTYIHLKYTLTVIDTMNIWQKESRDYMNVIRSQRHDFNFHLHAVVGLIENGEFEECCHYVSNMASEASIINDIMPIHDAVIGSMLYNMKENAKKKGIDIEYNITYDLEHVLCNAFEVNKILGNLIQNAIDAINSQEEKDYGIKVSIMKRRGNSVIIVSNLFLGDKETILHAYDLGYSTKTRHEGIGLSMISRTVEKYGGRIYTEFEEDVVSFIVNIPNIVHFEEE